jgi:hypothetical protein
MMGKPASYSFVSIKESKRVRKGDYHLTRKTLKPTFGNFDEILVI